MVKHLGIRVVGKVQGVWFRQSTKIEAEKLGLTGTVQNMPDGTVEIHAEGEEEKLQELLRWCEEGPQYAGVGSIEHSEAKVQRYESFKII